MQRSTSAEMSLGGRKIAPQKRRREYKYERVFLEDTRAIISDRVARPRSSDDRDAAAEEEVPLCEQRASSAENGKGEKKSLTQP
ncbi:hypothetical protein MRX96_001505 [Rhipicephalus microplus]